MAFDPDAYLASKSEPSSGGFDPDAYLASKADPEPTRETVDVGPAARRARAGMAPGERETSAEQAGVSPGLIRTVVGSPAAPDATDIVGRAMPQPSTEHAPTAADKNSFGFMLTHDIRPEGPAYIPPDTTVTRRHPGGAAATIHSPHLAGEMDDPLVQMGTAAAMGMAAGAPAAALPAQVARVVGPAIETGVANKAMGGDFTTGAVLGAAVPLLPHAARAGKAATRALGESMEGGATKEILRGRTKATGKVKNNAKFAGREDGSLVQVMNETPEVRKAILTDAHTDPGGAAKTLTKHIDAATDGNSAAGATIQKQHGGIPLQPIAERLAGLEDRLNMQGLGAAADAVNRMRTDLLKRYASDQNIGLADAKLSFQQIRNIRNKAWRAADPARTVDAGDARMAQAKIASILNKEIEDVAAQTRGVDVEALKARNRQISTLIPVRDALAQRAEKLADRDIGIGKKAKEAIGNVAAKATRKAKYALSSFPEANPAPVARPRTPLFNETQAAAPVEPPIVFPTAEARRRRELTALGLTAAQGGNR